MKIVLENNFFKKFIGLMFKKKISYGMYFKNVNMIHTFFMRCNIDVIGLDENNIVKEKHLNIGPNKIVFLKKSVNTLELPANCSDIYKLNDKIDLKI